MLLKHTVVVEALTKIIKIILNDWPSYFCKFIVEAIRLGDLLEGGDFIILSISSTVNGSSRCCN